MRHFPSTLPTECPASRGSLPWSMPGWANPRARILARSWLSAVIACLALTQPLRAQTDLDRLLTEAAAWESGQSKDPFRQLEGLVRQSVDVPVMRREVEAALAKLLAATATFEAQRFACQQLAIIGGNASLPALAKLLTHEQTAGIACLALTAYPPGKADEVLREALPTAGGNAQAQILNSIGDRRDGKSVKLLSAAARANDPMVATAAVAALAKIGDSAARKELSALARKSAPGLEAVFTEASLRCAGALAKAGDRKEAKAAYEELVSTTYPAYVRRSAFAGLLGLDKDGGEERILKVLHGTDAVLKPVAISAVRSLSGKGVSERFAAEMTVLLPEEQVWLIESLGARGRRVCPQSLGRQSLLRRTDRAPGRCRRVGGYGGCHFRAALGSCAGRRQSS